MTKAEQLITKHLDIWSAVKKARSSSGRGGNKKLELYGITKLRELILDLAVRGMLVPQDPKDEPASELLDLIAAEKGRLIRAGQIKRTKKNQTDPENELKCSLPPQWTRASLGDLGDFSGGKTPSKNNPEYWTGAIPWVTPKDMKTSRIEGAEDHVSELAVDDGLTIYCPGSILFVVRSGILRRIFPVAINTVSCTVNQDLKVLKPFEKSLSPYLMLMCKGFERIILKNLTKIGTTVESIVFDKFSTYRFPLPPLAEQHRIVAKVDELMALCDQLEEEQESNLETHETLVRTLLSALISSASEASQFVDAWQLIQDNFGILFTTESSVDQLKQTILQLAVMGKLVPQDPEDEPAEKLLKRITAENDQLIEGKNLRKQKSIHSIHEDEIPFCISEGWVWCRLSQIINQELPIAYGVLVPGPHVDGGVPLVRVGDLELISPNTLPEKHISHDIDSQFARTRLKGGEILMGVVGSIGKLGVAPSSWKGANIARALCRIVPSNNISKDYILIILQSRFMQKAFKDDIRVLAQPTLNLGLIRNAITPIPPLAEQLRIVAKVDQLMALCDQVKVSLASAKITQLNLADSLVEQAIK